MPLPKYVCSTADLCDAHEPILQILTPMMKSYGGNPAFGGRIRTLKLFEDNTLVRTVLEEDGEGQVLVVDGGGSLRCALLGDQLARMATHHDWEGIVVYGCIRDSAIIREMPIGVMALGTHPLKTVKRNTGQIDVPVVFGGVRFVPGHYLHADLDGIITSPETLTLV
jgi:regulator of ribonuclease activity A